jgi:hypothetical protein
MKENSDPVPFLVAITLICLTIGFIFQPDRSDSKVEDEVKSLRDDLNQLTVVVSELEPVIVVDGQVADETFDWNVFHNVPKEK